MARKSDNLSLKHDKSLQNSKYQLNLHNKYQFILLADQTTKMIEKYKKTAKPNKKPKNQKNISVKYSLISTITTRYLAYYTFFIFNIYTQMTNVSSGIYPSNFNVQ